MWLKNMEYKDMRATTTSPICGWVLNGGFDKLIKYHHFELAREFVLNGWVSVDEANETCEYRDCPTLFMDEVPFLLVNNPIGSRGATRSIGACETIRQIHGSGHGSR